MSDLGERVAVHSDALRTFCTALTGDAEEADALASRAVGAADSRAVRRGDLGADAAVWRAAVHEYVTSRSDRKQARVRAVRVLRELEDLEPRDIAPLVGRRTRWVSRQLARTPLHRPDGLEAVSPRRTGRAIALGAAVLLLVGLAAAGVLKARDDGPSAKELGAAPTVSGLLPWPARGELGRDRALHAAAAKLWRSSDSAVKATYVLWAGHASGGRLLLLQAAVGPERLIALVAEGDRGLHVVRVAAVPDSRGALLVEYGGPTPTEQAADGTAMRTLRVLVPPGTRSADRRGVVLGRPDASRFMELRLPGTNLADWRPLSVHDGLTDAWLDPVGGQPLTAVRLDQRSVSAQLVPPSPNFGLFPFAPRSWVGPPVRDTSSYPAAARLEESLALSQVLQSHRIEVRVVRRGDDIEPTLYAARATDRDCYGDCTVLYSVSHGDPYSGQTTTTRIELLTAIVSSRGSILIQDSDQLRYRLLGPAGAARCTFGTGVPAAPGAGADVYLLVGSDEFDGSFVCVDARGKVVDRAGRNTGFFGFGDH